MRWFKSLPIGHGIAVICCSILAAAAICAAVGMSPQMFFGVGLIGVALFAVAMLD